MAEWYCMVNGRKYGPIDEEGVRRWAAEGRLTPTDHVWSEGMADWSPATTVPGLFGQTALGPPTGGPPVLQPHRGTMVLVLGILGIVVCWICGIIAWVMGTKDIKEIDAGRMDPSGRQTTMAGKVCGIIGTILGIVGLVFLILYVIFIVSMFATFAAQGGLGF